MKLQLFDELPFGAPAANQKGETAEKEPHVVAHSTRQASSTRRMAPKIWSKSLRSAARRLRPDGVSV
jgi:hypothetical protein